VCSQPSVQSHQVTVEVPGTIGQMEETLGVLLPTFELSDAVLIHRGEG